MFTKHLCFLNRIIASKGSDGRMKHIAVYCGSRKGKSLAYEEGARELGKELAKRNITLVYGGSSTGLMGSVADAVLDTGGKVIGVILIFFVEQEVAHQNLTELITVESMHERKAKMAELADGFIALPGGPGTLEELFEIFTWAQIGIHQKPIGMLNIQQYYQPLAKWLDHMVSEGFMKEEFRSLAMLEDEPAFLINRFIKYV